MGAVGAIFGATEIGVTTAAGALGEHRGGRPAAGRVGDGLAARRRVAGAPRRRGAAACRCWSRSRSGTRRWRSARATCSRWPACCSSPAPPSRRPTPSSTRSSSSAAPARNGHRGVRVAGDRGLRRRRAGLGARGLGRRGRRPDRGLRARRRGRPGGAGAGVPRAAPPPQRRRSPSTPGPPATTRRASLRSRLMDVLIDADTIRSPELRHEIPTGIVDPFLYGERDGTAFAATSALDAASIAAGAARPSSSSTSFTDLGLQRPDRRTARVMRRCSRSALRACRAMGITKRRRPAHVSARDRGAPARRRDRAPRRPRALQPPAVAARPPAELRGIWRATKAAEAGLKAAAQALHEAETRDGILYETASR